MPDRNDQLQALGTFIRAQRRFANMSLRQMAELTKVSNPYLSQLERGLHEPSMRVIQAIASSLNLSTEAFLEQAGMIDHDASANGVIDTEVAIRSDARLTDDQKQALLTVYRSYVQVNQPTDTAAGVTGS